MPNEAVSQMGLMNEEVVSMGEEGMTQIPRENSLIGSEWLAVRTGNILVIEAVTVVVHSETPMLTLHGIWFVDGEVLPDEVWWPTFLGYVKEGYVIASPYGNSKYSWVEDNVPDDIWDVDGAGTTGFESNRSNRAY